MEEAQRIFDYLRVSYKNPTEKEHVEFLWDAFLTNYNAGKYPFALWQVNESTVFRFLKLIGLDNPDIGRFTKIVKERNDTAHSNGNIFYKNKESLEDKINEMLSCVEAIQEKSKPIIEKAFQAFLIDSQKPEEREFIDDEG